MEEITAEDILNEYQNVDIEYQDDIEEIEESEEK